MSQASEHDSNEQSSSQNMEYHSESEEKQIIPVNDSEGYTFLNIQFPLPYKFPKMYLVLNKVMSNIDDALPKPYVRTQDGIKDPDHALGYIIHHFNIDRVSHSIQNFPQYDFDQVYYSTYIDTSRYLSLQFLIDVTAHNLRVQNEKKHQYALVQKWLELQKRYARYRQSDDLSPYILQCIL